MTDRAQTPASAVGSAAATIAAVLVGGFLGTGLRLGADLLVPVPDDVIPISTLTVNLLGSLLLGVAVARVWPAVPGWVRGGLGTGLLGSFTTFSAVVLVASRFTVDGDPMLAIAYLLVSVVGGLGAAGLGLGLARRPEPMGPEE